MKKLMLFLLIFLLINIIICLLFNLASKKLSNYIQLNDNYIHIEKIHYSLKTGFETGTGLYVDINNNVNDIDKCKILLNKKFKTIKVFPLNYNIENLYVTDGYFIYENQRKISFSYNIHNNLIILDNKKYFSLYNLVNVFKSDDCL